MRPYLAAFVVVMGVGLAAAGDAVEVDKLVGVWKVVKGEVNKGARVEFLKDGKWKMTKKKNGLEYGRRGNVQGGQGPDRNHGRGGRREAGAKQRDREVDGQGDCVAGEGEGVAVAAGEEVRASMIEVSIEATPSG